MEQVTYAGFWKRFLAHIIDQIITGFVSFFLALPLLFFFGIFAALEFDEFEEFAMANFVNYDYDGAPIAILFIAIILFSIGAMIMQWLYCAVLESSRKQATVGKMILNIKVTDMDGNRITFARASGRFFAKIISGLIFNIGYIIAAFTEKKQALHDIIADCLIVNVDYFNYQHDRRETTRDEIIS